MITISKTIKSVGNFFDKMAKVRVQSWLMRMGREWVERNGYSYEDVQSGVSKWPWRQSPVKIAEEKEISRAIRELKSYNDNELRDIGIPRSKIEYMVRYGRGGDEFETDRAA
jgi:hypothetical protein